MSHLTAKILENLGSFVIIIPTQSAGNVFSYFYPHKHHKTVTAELLMNYVSFVYRSWGLWAQQFDGFDLLGNG